MLSLIRGLLKFCEYGEELRTFELIQKHYTQKKGVLNHQTKTSHYLPAFHIEEMVTEQRKIKRDVLLL